MLKYVITSLALTVGLSHPSIASESKTVRTDLICTDIITLDQVLNKYGEEAVLIMVSNRETRKGTQANATVFFMNAKTKTWTLVEKFTEKDYCIIAVGENVSPYYDEGSKKQNYKDPKVM